MIKGKKSKNNLLYNLQKKDLSYLKERRGRRVPPHSRINDGRGGRRGRADQGTEREGGEE